MCQIEHLIQKLLDAHEPSMRLRVSDGTCHPPTPTQEPPVLGPVCDSVEPANFLEPPNVVVCESPAVDASLAVPPNESLEGTADDLESETSEASVFQMRTEWLKRADEQGTYRISRRKSADKLTTKHQQSGKLNLKMKWGRTFRGERWRKMWALLSAATIIQDCISIPLLAFGRSPTWFLDVMEAAFWTINIPVLAWMLVVQDGWMLREAILVCLLEVVLVSMLIAELLTWVHHVDPATAFLRSVQLGRVLHLPRLYEWAGLARPVSNWMHGSSREVRALVNMALSLVLGMFFLHVLTCIWFGVREPIGTDGESLVGLPIQDQYRFTLEWALGRLHPVRTAENMLLPTQIERLVALLASGSALLFGSMFASLVTNDLADIRRVRRQQKETVHQVSDYLTIFPIPWDLEKQCKEFLRTKMASQAPPCKAEIAQLLPDFLYHEVCCEALTPIFAKHDFFAGLCRSHEAFRHDLCVRGLQDWNVAPHEVLFSAGLKCPSMLAVAHGCVLYSRSFARQRSFTFVTTSAASSRVEPLTANGNRDSNDDNLQFLCHGDLMCEPCLWTEWTYVGKATADSRTTLLCLSHEALMEVTRLHRAATAELILYARLFVNALKDVPDEDRTDLPVPMDNLPF